MKTAVEIILLTNSSNRRRFHGCFLLEGKKRDKRFKILELVTVFKTEQVFFFLPGAPAAHQHHVGDEVHGTKMTHQISVYQLGMERKAEEENTH